MIAPTARSKIDEQTYKLLEILGYIADPDFIDSLDEQNVVQPRYVLEVAFHKIGILGALCPRSSYASGGQRNLPVIYVVPAANLEDANKRHRAIWSQSVVPQILMVLPEGFQIRNGYDYRHASKIFPWSSLDTDGLHDALVPLTSHAIRSSVSWKDYSAENRVDSRIGHDIRNLSIKVSKNNPEIRNRQDIIISLIGKMLYLYILFDRNIICQEWVDSLVDSDGRPLCQSINFEEGYGPDSHSPREWPIDEVWHLLDAIDDILNGAIFPLPSEARPLVKTETLHLVRRALRSDLVNERGEQQYSFLDVDYATIRTETISAIYECFFELHGDGERRKHGAYYTPSFLVDYIVQESDRIRPLTGESKVVDPACGSGAFLVAAYRYILEYERSRLGDLNVDYLRRILRECICGIELKKQAADVARFSLCLTMLDYLPGWSIGSLQAELRGGRLFPEQAEIVLNQNAFDPLPQSRVQAATHVLGNPPWTKADLNSSLEAFRLDLVKITRTLSTEVDTGSAKKSAAQQRPRNVPRPKLVGRSSSDRVVDNHSYAEYFYWYACYRLARQDAVIAFILPTKCFVAPSARHFPDAVARRSRIRGIVNLTSFRRKLFPDTEEAATILFAMPGNSEPMAWAWRFSPRLASQPVGPDGRPWAIVIDRDQVEKFRLGELIREDHHWYQDFFLQPLDRYIVSALKTTSGSFSLMNVEGFLKASGMHASVGESPDRASLPEEYVLGTSKDNDFRVALGLLDRGKSPLDLEGKFVSYDLPDSAFELLSDRLKRKFRGPMVMMPRAQSGAYVVGRAAYNSSIQGIYFVNEIVPAEHRVHVLQQLVLYLKTSVGRYLLSLFGRQWVADQRRFETPDLMRLPLPYRNHKEILEYPISNFVNNSIIDQVSFAEFAAHKFSLSSVFVDAVLEHREMREPFQNGKRATIATEPVTKKVYSKYKAAIEFGLKELLVETPFELRHFRRGKYNIEVRVIMSDEPSRIVEKQYPGLSPNIGQETAVEIHDHGEYAIARLIKSSTKTAWTVERAFADALNVANRIMSE